MWPARNCQPYNLSLDKNLKLFLFTQWEYLVKKHKTTFFYFAGRVLCKKKLQKKSVTSSFYFQGIQDILIRGTDAFDSTVSTLHGVSLDTARPATLGNI